MVHFFVIKGGLKIRDQLAHFGYIRRSAAICSLLGNFTVCRLLPMPAFEGTAAREVLQ